MQDLQTYLQDGAGHQARAVLAYLQHLYRIEESWDDKWKRYSAEPKVARWENCREQGYIVSLKTENFKQINIAFFEHRNHDGICAVMWEQLSLNSLTINTAEFKGIYRDKYDVSYDVKWGEAAKMAEWIAKQLHNFWIKNIKKENK